MCVCVCVVHALGRVTWYEVTRCHVVSSDEVRMYMCVCVCVCVVHALGRVTWYEVTRCHNCSILTLAPHSQVPSWPESCAACVKGWRLI